MGYQKRTDPEVLVYFTYEHLPESLQLVSQGFGELAYSLVEMLPDNAQRAVALDYLLIAKDAAVRSALPPGKARI